MPPPPSRPWALITPASRGIGRALARRVLSTTEVTVVATARGDLDGARDAILDGLSGVHADARLEVLKMDVLDEDSIASAAAACRTRFPPPRDRDNDASDSWHLHLAFCLPGILLPERSPANVDAAGALLAFRTNTLGPLLAIKHFSPLLPRRSTRHDASSSAYAGLPGRAAVWANMSARVGSVADNRLGGWYSYRASKAGVNQITKTFDHHLRARAGGRAMAVALHPGTVRTGLSREFWASVHEDKLFSPEFASERLLEVVRRLDVDTGRGKCWDWKGEEVPP